MDNSQLKASVAAIQTAFEAQQVLKITYVNARDQVSVRNIVPCSPFATNTDGTLNFQAYNEIVETQGRDNGPGVCTFRVDRILKLELNSDIEIGDYKEFWRTVLGDTNGGTVVFPGPKTPLNRGKYPDPTVTTEALEVYKARGWTTEPTPGFVQKAAVAQPRNRAWATTPRGARLLQ